MYRDPGTLEGLAGAEDGDGDDQPQEGGHQSPVVQLVQLPDIWLLLLMAGWLGTPELDLETFKK